MRRGWGGCSSRCGGLSPGARGGRADEIRLCIGVVQDCRRAEGIVACTVHARTDFDPAEERHLRRFTVEGGPVAA